MPFYINILLNVFNFFNHQTLKADAPDLFQKAVLLSETLNLRRLLRGKSVRSSWPKERADHQRIMCFNIVSLFFSSLTLCLNLCQRGSPSDINSVPTCPNQNWSTTNEQKFDNRTTLTTRINVPFLPFLPSPAPRCLSVSNSAWRFGQKAKHLPWPPKMRKIWSEAIFKKSHQALWSSCFSWTWDHIMNHGHLMTNDICILCRTKNKNRGCSLGGTANLLESGNLALHPLLGKRFQVHRLLNHAFRSLKADCSVQSYSLF